MSHQISLVLFTASQCAYCPAMKKNLEEIIIDRKKDIAEYTAWIVDKQPSGLEVAKEWLVTGVPTLLILANQQELGRVVGTCTKEELERIVEGSLQPDVFQEPSGGNTDTSDTVLCDSGESEYVREGSD